MQDEKWSYMNNPLSEDRVPMITSVSLIFFQNPNRNKSRIVQMLFVSVVFSFKAATNCKYFI